VRPAEGGCRSRLPSRGRGGAGNHPGQTGRRQVPPRPPAITQPHGPGPVLAGDMVSVGTTCQRGLTVPGLAPGTA
jgi:hypothetical protein